jgi:hypothetical protein
MGRQVPSDWLWQEWITPVVESGIAAYAPPTIAAASEAAASTHRMSRTRVQRARVEPIIVFNPFMAQWIRPAGGAPEGKAVGEAEPRSS